jgi:hypothetical protein
MRMSETFNQNSLGQQVSTQCQSIGLLTITTLQVQVKEKKYDVSPMIMLLQRRQALSMSQKKGKEHNVSPSTLANVTNSSMPIQ